MEKEEEEAAARNFLEMITVWDFLVDQMCAAVNAISIILMEKVSAFIALEEIYAASKNLYRSLKSELVICQKERKVLNKILEYDGYTYLEKKRRENALDLSNNYEQVLRLAIKITNNETKVLESIMFKYQSENEIVVLHSKHQRVMMVENATMDQLRNAKELYDEIMKDIDDEEELLAYANKTNKDVVESLETDIKNCVQEREKVKKMTEQAHKYTENQNITIMKALELLEKYKNGLRKMLDVNNKKYSLLISFYDEHGTEDQKSAIQDAIDKLDIKSLSDELISMRESLKQLMDK